MSLSARPKSATVRKSQLLVLIPKFDQFMQFLLKKQTPEPQKRVQSYQIAMEPTRTSTYCDMLHEYKKKKFEIRKLCDCIRTFVIMVIYG